MPHNSYFLEVREHIVISFFFFGTLSGFALAEGSLLRIGFSRGSFCCYQEGFSQCELSVGGISEQHCIVVALSSAMSCGNGSIHLRDACSKSF